MALTPRMVMAGENGDIYDDPSLLMVCNRGGQWSLPAKEDLSPLPPESDLFLLPARRAVGFNPETGKIETVEELAVAAFAAPGYTLSAHPAYFQEADAPMLPLFAYGAVGYANGRFWICASRTDNEPRQVFTGIGKERLENNAKRLLSDYPRNRLVAHIINNCVRRYSCPAARNFALGRYEAPLPTSRACNAQCIGCISAQRPDSPITTTPQCRLSFVPTSHEIVEVMQIHEQREKKTPIYSFGQGCEGDPLANAELLAESISMFRMNGGGGTVNCNTNASSPEKVAMLAEAGLTSMRVSLNSARAPLYEAYYRPQNYNFSSVRASIRIARAKGIFVSLNLLYFPGITDTVEELDALADLCRSDGVSMIQWRNLNIDPEWFIKVMPNKPQAGAALAPALGLRIFMKKLKKMCPWLRYGYFNPWLGTQAVVVAPEPTSTHL